MNVLVLQTLSSVSLSLISLLVSAQRSNGTCKRQIQMSWKVDPDAEGALSPRWSQTYLASICVTGTRGQLVSRHDCCWPTGALFEKGCVEGQPSWLSFSFQFAQVRATIGDADPSLVIDLRALFPTSRSVRPLLAHEAISLDTITSMYVLKRIGCAVSMLEVWPSRSRVAEGVRC